MKVTDEMVKAFKDACPTWVPGLSAQVGLEAVLALLPGVEPFAFSGYPDNPVWLHMPCGTVMDTNTSDTNHNRETLAQIKTGECDCESSGPWRRIYVGEAA